MSNRPIIGIQERRSSAFISFSLIVVSLGVRGEEVEAERAREVGAHARWPRMLLPASSSGGENAPSTPLPGATGFRWFVRASER
ncbi:hypothetical protein [Tessaracoccus flavescens]|uniref:hypothetical protein n=1 Tax=Tessaracoccus flavescens TaxID=399497 RepID=UPI001F4683FC|nr:hypothetical protein [Tessaracoccus flavescens]